MVSCVVRNLAVIIVLLFSANALLEAKPEADADMKIRDQMVQISRELGVTCTYCHNSENFKDSKNKNFGIALKHMKITQLLNSDQGFKGKPAVTCYVCHQGEAKFDYDAGHVGASVLGEPSTSAGSSSGSKK